MTNPAQLLHARFVSWNSPSGSAQNVRGLNGENWAEHALAVRHLQEIDELLRMLESRGRDTRVARSAIPRWYQVVFAFNQGWTSSGTAIIDQHDIDILEQLAERLEDVVPEVDENGIDEIAKYLDSVQAVLTADSSLPSELRKHIHDVVEHAKWCATNYMIVGDFSLQDALERLSGAIVRGAANSADKGKWRNLMDKFVWPFTVNVVSALPTATLTALAAAG